MRIPRPLDLHPSRPAIILALVVSLACPGCAPGPTGSLVVIDPVLPYLSPEAARDFRASAAAWVELPAESPSAALYAALDQRKPASVILTPLLAGEATTVLGTDPALLVGTFGGGTATDAERSYVARFDPIDAASIGGDLVGRIMADREKAGTGGIAAGVFAGDGAVARAEAFVAAYARAGGPGEPVVETTDGEYSGPAAARLRSLDVACAYFAAPPKDLTRWLREALDPASFAVAETPFAGDGPALGVGASVTWDIRATVAAMRERMDSRRSGAFPGLWTAVAGP